MIYCSSQSPTETTTKCIVIMITLSILLFVNIHDSAKHCFVLSISPVGELVMGTVDRLLFISVIGLPITLIDLIIIFYIQSKSLLEFSIILVALQVFAQEVEIFIHFRSFATTQSIESAESSKRCSSCRVAQDAEYNCVCIKHFVV